MVRIPLRKFPFLSADYVQDGEIATIIQSPSIISAEQSKFGKEQTILTIRLRRDNKTYRWTLNDASNDTLVTGFGNDGDDWVGEEILIQKRTMIVRGISRDVLFAELTQIKEDVL